uniref:hypothetical protein n=1 Tax=Pontiella sp. TaxID=2837462 RepID=UPI0035617991
SGGMTLSWTAVSGAGYRVMTTTNLVRGPWIEVTHGIYGNDEPVSVTNAVSAGPQFFRIDYEQ